MDEPYIRCRDDGPFVLHGPLKVVDAEGNVFELPSDKPRVALCRCGHSQRKPFCDGSHKECGFVASERAKLLHNDPPDSAPS